MTRKSQRLQKHVARHIVNSPSVTTSVSCPLELLLRGRGGRVVGPMMYTGAGMRPGIAAIVTVVTDEQCRRNQNRLDALFNSQLA